MSATRLKTVKPTKAVQEIAMQDASLDIWDKKYRLKDKQEQPVDKDINATYMSGHFSMVRSRLAVLSLTQALRHTNLPPPLLTAQCPA